MKNFEITKKQLRALLDGNYENITVLSNASAFLNEYLNDVNWVGFYLVKDNDLILGPFQGKPACSFIPNGKGVCGTCLAKKETMLVNNVHEFTGHIACDSRSNSEIVVPMFKNNEVVAVLDIDSESFSRFEKQKEEIEELAKIIEDFI